MPRRANATSFGAINGNDPAKAGRSRAIGKALGADVRLIRQRYREAAAQTVPYLRQLALGQVEGASNQDRTRAADLLAKYGIGTQQEIALNPVSLADLQAMTDEELAARRAAIGKRR